MDDLDPDLFDDLNEVCRQNQLTYQPIARGRNAEGYVLEKYPEIISQLEQDRQRRIDSMRLGSHLHEDEVREEKLKVGSIEKQGFPSPMVKTRQTMQSLSSKASIESPLLRAKPSNGDLMFPMDDENSLPPAIDTRITSTPQPKMDVNDRESASAQANSQSDALTTQRNRSPGAPWGLFGPTTPRAGLKDIMAETSDSKAVPSRAFSVTRDTDAPRPTPSKMSQKERKKMKQQQLHEVFTEPEQPNAASPWQVPTKKPKSPFNAPLQARSPSPASQQSKAPLTLRQTVARTPPAPANVTPEPLTSSRVKSPSNKRASETSASNDDNRPSATAKFINSSPLPLAAILQQQQFEKDLIREAATAKHNLQDIQIEQEFQQWWEAESRRVMEEEAAAAAAAIAATSTHSHSGRGGNAGRGRGKTRGSIVNGQGRNRGVHGQNNAVPRTGPTKPHNERPVLGPQGSAAPTNGDPRPPPLQDPLRTQGTQDKIRNNERGRDSTLARGRGSNGAGNNRGSGRGRGRTSHLQQ